MSYLLRSLALSFLALVAALEAFLALSDRCLAVSFLARAIPPSLASSERACFSISSSMARRLSPYWRDGKIYLDTVLAR